MKPILFYPDAFKDYVDWGRLNKKNFDKINELIIDISRDAFKGLGKPEPLKANWKGYWSRRITDEHRLIYKIQNDIITIASCHGHYL